MDLPDHWLAVLILYIILLIIAWLLGKGEK
jgi:hypothetical protein